MKYIFTSFSSSIIDIVLFIVLCALFRPLYSRIYIVVATVIARIISASYNYIMNYKMVFHSTESVKMAGLKYGILAVVQMSLSAVLVTLIIDVFSIMPEFAVKMFVDIVLFFISYHIQQKYVFNKKQV